MSNDQIQVATNFEIEHHEIGLTFEEYECPLCGGTGEISGEDPDGLEYSDQCPDCNGEGIVYASRD
jgi:DnaJ-class molecular chaperone